LYSIGTCYHDLGNLNLTILTTRADYNRKENLKWIIDTLNRTYNLTLRTTDRDDIFLDTYKVTGSASRLERLYAYHHFTLLLNADLTHLRRSLKSPDQTNITSKATSSVRSSVFNLSNRNPSITYDRTLELLIKTFFQWTNESNTSNYDYIDPLLYTDKIQTHENELQSNKFMFDATPPFIYKILIDNQTIELTISNGLITDIKDERTLLNKDDYLGKCFHTIYESIQKIKQNNISLPG